MMACRSKRTVNGISQKNMKFKQVLQPATLVRRYKRFLADVAFPDGETLTVHCPNSGSMLGCIDPGSQVLVSRSDNPSRKYPHTLEMIRVNGGWVGINTSLTNRIVREGFEKGVITEVGPVDAIKAEVKVSAGSRLDFLLASGSRRIYVEVKNCTLAEAGTAMFPDAVTVRGTKHLHELMRLAAAGNGAMVCFLVQRMDAERFAPARRIDPVYAETLAQALRQGVMVAAYQADVQPERIEIVRRLPVTL